MFDERTVQILIQKIDIVKYIASYTPLMPIDGYFVGKCPFHEDEEPSLYVDYNKQTFCCYKCGASGNIVNFTMHMNNCSASNAIISLAEKYNINISKPQVVEENIELTDAQKKMFDINRDTAKFYYDKLHGDNGKEGMKYFRDKRQLSDKTMLQFGLGYAGKFGHELHDHLLKKGYTTQEIMDAGLVKFSEKGNEYFDAFWNRVMYPILNRDNKVIGFGGRVLDDSKPKYLNSPETSIFDKSCNLYGLNIAQHTNKKYYICCEGYMDVIGMHQGGFDNAVASLGTALTQKQVKILASLTDTVYLAYDGDLPGIKAGLRAIELFDKVGITTKVIHMTPCKDPDEFIKTYGKEEFEKRIEEAENSSYFRVRALKMEDFDLASEELIKLL